jgi:hypothetical protein
MYYPENMTAEDIEAFELDMAALTLREEMEAANWLLMEAADTLRDAEVYMDWVVMVADLVGVAPIIRG